MGMFDSVLFDCPGCGTELDIQSKAGNCLLNRYRMPDIPPAIAGDIINREVVCHNIKCRKVFKVAGYVLILGLQPFKGENEEGAI